MHGATWGLATSKLLGIARLVDQQSDKATSFGKRHVYIQQSQPANHATKIRTHPEVRKLRRVHRNIVRAPGALPWHQNEAIRKFSGEEDEAKVQDNLVPAVEPDNDF